jgi:hypothetical protein
MEQPQERIETGYEGYNPLTGEISQVLTHVKVMIGLVMKASEKGERGYIDYIKKLNSHHMLKALRWISRFRPELVSDLNRSLLQVSDSPERLEILNKVYTACRILDDAVDGDSPQKLSADHTLIYATDAVAHFRDESFDNRNAVDVFLKDALDKCHEIGLDIKGQVLLVLESVQFDAERRAEFLRAGKPRFYSEDELSEYYHRLDIEGTVGACLELTAEGDCPSNQLLVTPLATASRYFYDIRDLAKEVRQGLVNISAEEAERLGIDIDSLYSWAFEDSDYATAPDGIKAWIAGKVRDGQKLLGDHERCVSTSSFKRATRDILEGSFVAQCEPFFAKMDPLISEWAM